MFAGGEEGVEDGVALGGVFQADAFQVLVEDLLGFTEHLAGDAGLVVDALQEEKAPKSRCVMLRRRCGCMHFSSHDRKARMSRARAGRVALELIVFPRMLTLESDYLNSLWPHKLLRLLLRSVDPFGAG